MTNTMQAQNEKSSHSVRLYHHELGDLGPGKLFFDGNSIAQVIFGAGLPDGVIEATALHRVLAVEEHWNGFSVEPGKRFTLCNCQVRNLGMFAEFVIEGDVARLEFHSIAVQYSDVSEWFLAGQRVDGKVGETLSWQDAPEPIDVTINSEVGQFRVLSEAVSYLETRGEDTVAHEHIEFTFTATGAPFTPSDFHARTHELGCFFSLLMAFPATVLWMSVSTDGKRFQRVHVPGFNRVEKSKRDTHWASHFVQRRQLDGRWQEVFGSYYGSTYRRVCWVRLAGMQRYEGFWDYKTLGYVSLLDSYLELRFKSVRSSASSIPPSRKRIAQVRREIASRGLQLDEKGWDCVLDAVRSVFAVSRVDFAGRYALLQAQMDRDVLKILSLTDDDFTFIKDVRNKIAHGSDHGLKSGQYEKVVRVEAKILFLMFSCFLEDIGFGRQDVIDSLAATRNTLRSVAALDEVHLERLTGSAEFIQVSRERLNEFKNLPGIRAMACFIETEEGEVLHSRELTETVKAWSRAPGKGGIMTVNSVFGLAEDSGRFIHHVYFEHGDDHLEVFSSWMIKASFARKQ